jgi:hypothetical protein
MQLKEERQLLEINPIDRLILMPEWYFSFVNAGQI